MHQTRKRDAFNTPSLQRVMLNEAKHLFGATPPFPTGCFASLSMTESGEPAAKGLPSIYPNRPCA